MNKLTKKFTMFLVSFVALMMLAVPVFAEGTIDFAAEKITGLTNKDGYSFDNATWYPVIDGTSALDISAKINTKAGFDVYVKDLTDPEAEVQKLTVPKRAIAPTKVVFVPKANADDDTIGITAAQEFKLGLSEWSSPDEDKGLSVRRAEIKGATFQVRTKAVEGSAFASLAADVKVPVMPVAPAKAKYDIVKDGVVVAAGQEYFIVSAEGATWTSVVPKQTMLTRAQIRAALGDSDNGTIVLVRTKATAKIAASNAAKITVPAVRVAPATGETGVRLDLAKEKIYGVKPVTGSGADEAGYKISYEYRALTDAQAVTATYDLPKWTSIAADGEDISKKISASSVKAPVTRIEVRRKAVPATTGSNAKPELPASSPAVFKIAKRPAAPAATAATFNMADFKLETMKIAETNQYLIGAATTWLTGSDEIQIGKVIPASGAPVVVQVRTAAVPGTPGVDGDVYVPASTPNKTIKILARPKAPNAVFNTKAKKITGVTTKMEFMVGKDGSYAAVPGTSIDLSSQEAGKTISVYVRVKGTDKAAASEATTVSCAIPTPAAK